MNGFKNLMLHDISHVFPAKHFQIGPILRIHTGKSNRRFWSLFEFSKKKRESREAVTRPSKELVSPLPNKIEELSRIQMPSPRTAMTVSTSSRQNSSSYSFQSELPVIPKCARTQNHFIKQEAATSLLDGNPVPKNLELKLKGYKTLVNEQTDELGFVSYQYNTIPQTKGKIENNVSSNILENQKGKELPEENRGSEGRTVFLERNGRCARQTANKLEIRSGNDNAEAKSKSPVQLESNVLCGAQRTHEKSELKAPTQSTQQQVRSNEPSNCQSSTEFQKSESDEKCSEQKHVDSECQVRTCQRSTEAQSSSEVLAKPSPPSFELYSEKAKAANESDSIDSSVAKESDSSRESSMKLSECKETSANSSYYNSDNSADLNSSADRFRDYEKSGSINESACEESNCSRSMDCSESPDLEAMKHSAPRNTREFDELDESNCWWSQRESLNIKTPQNHVKGKMSNCAATFSRMQENKKEFRSGFDEASSGNSIPFRTRKSYTTVNTCSLIPENPMKECVKNMNSGSNGFANRGNHVGLRLPGANAYSAGLTKIPGFVDSVQRSQAFSCNANSKTSSKCNSHEESICKFPRDKPSTDRKCHPKQEKCQKDKEMSENQAFCAKEREETCSKNENYKNCGKTEECNGEDTRQKGFCCFQSKKENDFGRGQCSEAKRCTEEMRRDDCKETKRICSKRKDISCEEELADRRSCRKRQSCCDKVEECRKSNEGLEFCTDPSRGRKNCNGNRSRECENRFQRCKRQETRSREVCTDRRVSRRGSCGRERTCEGSSKPRRRSCERQRSCDKRSRSENCRRSNSENPNSCGNSRSFSSAPNFGTSSFRRGETVRSYGTCGRGGSKKKPRTCCKKRSSCRTSSKEKRPRRKCRKPPPKCLSRKQIRCYPDFERTTVKDKRRGETRKSDEYCCEKKSGIKTRDEDKDHAESAKERERRELKEIRECKQEAERKKKRKDRAKKKEAAKATGLERVVSPCKQRKLRKNKSSSSKEVSDCSKPKKCNFAKSDGIVGFAKELSSKNVLGTLNPWISDSKLSVAKQEFFLCPNRVFCTAHANCEEFDLQKSADHRRPIRSSDDLQEEDIPLFIEIEEQEDDKERS